MRRARRCSGRCRRLPPSRSDSSRRLGPRSIDRTDTSDAGRRPTRALGIGTTELIGISNATFRNVLQTSTEACFRLMADMSQRLHRRLGEIDALTLQNATYRMVNYLLALPDPGADAPGGTIHLSVPKGVLASRLSITQETFSRILHNLAREGLIEVRGAAIRIRDPEGLRAFGRD